LFVKERLIFEIRFLVLKLKNPPVLLGGLGFKKSFFVYVLFETTPPLTTRMRCLTLKAGRMACTNILVRIILKFYLKSTQKFIVILLLMQTLPRTLIAQTPTLVGQTVKLQGWVKTKRDHGKITFIDLRDRSGVVQCVGYKLMGELTGESVIELTGLVKARPEKLVNTELPTGTIEIEVHTYQVLNPAKELPILVEGDGKDVSEEVRLKYRYLDLRRERMQHILRLRSKFFRALREALYTEDFVEIETPLLTKATKEGARDFLVPSRFQKGKFYALPQSPQQYKQLLMTGGFERYFQVARCIRDEDLRADRLFELTQLDVEMSFVTQEDVMNTMETVVKKAVSAVGGKLKSETFPVINYPDAMAKYGADKFDLRTPEEKAAGVLAFAWVTNFPFFKKVDKADAAEVIDGKSGWTFTHNPFSSPLPEHEADHLAGTNTANIITAQYDLVCNGYEVGGGSIRAHKPEVLKATFKTMGYTDEQIEAGVGHMLRAFEVGTPPHGGIALGLDRFIMVLTGEESIKETIAFPMSSTGRTAVMDAPNVVPPEQLRDLGLSVLPVTKPSSS
jgi:aspartyl-tRNA synthetase